VEQFGHNKDIKQRQLATQPRQAELEEWLPITNPRCFAQWKDAVSVKPRARAQDLRTAGNMRIPSRIVSDYLTLGQERSVTPVC